MKTIALTLACALAACGGGDVTGVSLEVHADPALSIDRYQIKLGERVGLVDAAPVVNVLAADDLGGQTVDLEVWGLTGTLQRAHGMTSVTLAAHEMPTYVVELDSVSCSDSCEDGAVRCSGDGVSTCETGTDGCSTWGTAVACPSGTPFCSNGLCGATCVDECAVGATECNGSLSERTCGNFDTDTCLEWSTPSACGSGETCNGDHCATAGCEETGCSAPPAPMCIAQDKVRAYDDGTCESDGSCSYQATDHLCDLYGTAYGCHGGLCGCGCSRAGECCRAYAQANGGNADLCQSWDIQCSLERPGDHVTEDANAYVRMYCPEITCYRDE